jgi:hypothetical protein
MLVVAPDEKFLSTIVTCFKAFVTCRLSRFKEE